MTTAKSMDIDPNQQLRNYVKELLKSPDLGQDINENVRISFFLTTDGEIVVLKTDSRTPKLDQFIKARMNYKKTDIMEMGIEANRIYNLKVLFDLKV
ncbi:hypothetical protein GCM10025777_00910 [Membranihabitans marinus]